MCPMSAPTDLSIPEHLFTEIDHVGIAVRDLDAAVELDERVVGMKLAHRETN